MPRRQSAWRAGDSLSRSKNAAFCIDFDREGAHGSCPSPQASTIIPGQQFPPSPKLRMGSDDMRKTSRFWSRTSVLTHGRVQRKKKAALRRLSQVAHLLAWRRRSLTPSSGVRPALPDACPRYCWGCSACCSPWGACCGRGRRWRRCAGCCIGVAQYGHTVQEGSSARWHVGHMFFRREWQFGHRM